MRPFGEAGIDRLGEGEDPLGDPTGGRDHHGHHELRLEQDHLDVADARRLERRRGHEREQVRDLRKRVRGRAERLVDVALRLREVQSQRRRRPRLELPQDAIDVGAVARVRRNTPCGRVRVGQETVLLEHRELVLHRGGGRLDAGTLDKRPRADGCARGDVALDDARRISSWRRLRIRTRSASSMDEG